MNFKFENLFGYVLHIFQRCLKRFRQFVFLKVIVHLPALFEDDKLLFISQKHFFVFPIQWAIFILLTGNLNDQVDFFLSPVVRELITKLLWLSLKFFEKLSPGLFFLVVGKWRIIFGKDEFKLGADEILEGVDGDTKLFGLVNDSESSFGSFRLH